MSCNLTHNSKKSREIKRDSNQQNIAVPFFCLFTLEGILSKRTCDSGVPCELNDAELILNSQGGMRTGRRDLPENKKREDCKLELYKAFPVYCAWCHKCIGSASVEHSHGICAVCGDNLRKEVEDFKRGKGGISKRHS